MQLRSGRIIGNFATSATTPSVNKTTPAAPATPAPATPTPAPVSAVTKDFLVTTIGQLIENVSNTLEINDRLTACISLMRFIDKYSSHMNSDMFAIVPVRKRFFQVTFHKTNELASTTVNLSRYDSDIYKNFLYINSKVQKKMSQILKSL